jgi:hypothetical protein
VDDSAPGRNHEVAATIAAPDSRARGDSRREADWLTVQRERTDTGFFGRGAATTWRLALEPHEVATNSIDLGRLSEVLIGVAYRSFLQ